MFTNYILNSLLKSGERVHINSTFKDRRGQIHEVLPEASSTDLFHCIKIFYSGIQFWGSCNCSEVEAPLRLQLVVFFLLEKRSARQLGAKP